MSDFVDEVEEQLRAERYASLFGRLWPWFAAALIATIVGWLGVWGYQTWQDRDISRASLAYDKAVTAMSAGDQAGAENDLASVAKSGPPGYRSLALMAQANIRLAAGKDAEAASLFDQAAKAAPNRIFGDLARLRAAQALMDSAPLAESETRLTALIGAKKPFDLEAREALALAKLQAGKTQEARGDFNAISLTLGVSPAMHGRAQAAMALIDSGQGAMVGQVVKAAATLTPSAQANAAKILSAASSPAAASGPDPSGVADPAPSGASIPSTNP